MSIDQLYMVLPSSVQNRLQSEDYVISMLYNGSNINVVYVIVADFL